LWAKFLNPARWPAWSKARVSGFDRVNSYFKKNSKRRRFSKKKKNSTGYNRVLPGHCLCNFFINPARFQPRAGPGFKTLAAGEPHPQPQYQTATKWCGGITVPPHPMYYELQITTVIHHAFLLLFFLYFFNFFNFPLFFFFFFCFFIQNYFFFSTFLCFLFFCIYIFFQNYFC